MEKKKEISTEKLDETILAYKYDKIVKDILEGGEDNEDSDC